MKFWVKPEFSTDLWFNYDASTQVRQDILYSPAFPLSPDPTRRCCSRWSSSSWNRCILVMFTSIFGTMCAQEIKLLPLHFVSTEWSFVHCICGNDVWCFNFSAVTVPSICYLLAADICHRRTHLSMLATHKGQSFLRHVVALCLPLGDVRIGMTPKIQRQRTMACLSLPTWFGRALKSLQSSSRR